MASEDWRKKYEKDNSQDKCLVIVLQNRDCLVCYWFYGWSYINMKLTEEEVRQEFRKHRKDKVFAKCWSATNDSFYEWCSLYLDYQHITKKNKKKLQNEN